MPITIRYKGKRIRMTRSLISNGSVSQLTVVSTTPMAIMNSSASSGPDASLPGWNSLRIGNCATPAPISAGVASAVVITPIRSDRRKKSASGVRLMKWYADTPVRNTPPTVSAAKTTWTNAVTNVGLLRSAEKSSSRNTFPSTR